MPFWGPTPSWSVFDRRTVSSSPSRVERVSATWRATSSERRKAPPLLRALERTTRFRRFKASDVHAILRAGVGAPTPRPAGGQLRLDLPSVPTRPLSAYAFEAVS
jgi:hypothetical protein